MNQLISVLKLVFESAKGFLNDFITSTGYTFTLQPWMVVAALVLGVLLFFPAIILVSGTYLGMYANATYPQVDIVTAIMLGITSVFVLQYVLVYATGTIYGRMQLRSGSIKDQDVLLYKILHKDLPKYGTTKEEFETMSRALFNSRKKIRKYVFNTDLNGHLPSKLDEKTVELVKKLKEYVIYNNYHSLSADQQRMLINVQKLNNGYLQNKVNEQIGNAQQPGYIPFDNSVFNQRPVLNTAPVVIEHKEVITPREEIKEVITVESYSNDALFHREEIRESNAFACAGEQKDIYSFFKKTGSN